MRTVTLSNPELSFYNDEECSAANETCPGGYGLNQTSYTQSSDCALCINNTYSPADFLYCLPCPNNTYSNTGSTSTDQCVRDDTTSCDAGYYYNGTLCEMCPNNTYSDRAATSCNRCPDDTISERGSKSDADCTRSDDDDSCGAGYYLDEDCKICPNGTYSFKGDLECTNCTGNYTSPSGSTSSSNCTERSDDGDDSFDDNETSCPAGSYIDDNNCVLCPNDTFSFLTDSESCTDCPANHTSPAGSTNPEKCTRTDGAQGCEAGNYYEEECMMCPNNTYSLKGDVKCTNCTGDYTSPAGSTSPDNCTDPEDGFKPCEAGYYYITASNNCSECSAGYYSPGEGSGGHAEESCTQCKAGTFSRSPGSAQCLPCGGGSYSDEGATDCTACKAGTYNGKSSASNCSVCSAGTYSDSGAIQCLSCQKGTFSSEGSTLCFTCPAGSYSSAKSGECTACSAGYYSAERAGECTACSAGDYSSSNATSCSTCSAGTYSGPAADTCTDCAAGSYSFEGSAQCVLCPPGQYSDEQAAECSTCVPGTFANETGSANCSDCLAGSYSARGAESCRLCSAGSYSEGGASQCTECPQGGVSEEGASSCSACSPGQYESNGRCMECREGTYSTDGASDECQTCSAGTYSAANATQCSPCSAGTYSREGAEQCMDCEAGSVSEDKAGVCTACLVGQYEVDNTQCESCSAGSYSGARSTECTECEAGRYSVKEASECMVCTAGYYSKAGAGVCTVCSAGYYSRAAAAGCSACSDGEYSFEGSDTCGLCQPGTYSGAKAPNCTTCEEGTYSEEAAYECTSCGKGKTSKAGSDKDGCYWKPCIAGYYLTIKGCKFCPAGQYSEPGAEACRSCPVNTYSTGAAGECTACADGYVSDEGSTKADDCTKQRTVYSLEVSGADEQHYLSGSTYNLTCLVNSTWLPEVTWSFNGLNTESTTTLNSDGLYQSVYSIESAETSDSGKYKCSLLSFHKDDVTLTFHDAISELSKEWVSAGSDYVLTCYLFPEYTSTFYYNNAEQTFTENSNSDSSITSAEGDVVDGWSTILYTVANVQLSFSVSCNSTKGDVVASEVKRTVYLWVFQSETESVKLVKGTDLVITCYQPLTVDSTMSYYRASAGIKEVVTESVRNTTVHEMQYHVFRWILSGIGDDTEFSCSAVVDKVAVTTTTVTVQVVAISAWGGGIVDTSPFNVSCKLEDKASGVVPTWYQDSVEVDSPVTYEVEGVDILSMTTSNYTVIKCDYGNDVSVETEAIFIDFTGPAALTEVRSDNTMTMQCQYTTFLTLSLQWHHKGTKDSNVDITTDTTGSTTTDTLTASDLSFSPMSFTSTYSEDSYKYKKTFSTTTWARKVTTSLPATTYVTSADAVLSCQYGSTYTPITVTWTKDGSPIADSNYKSRMASGYEMLSKLQLSDTDSSSYSCVFTDAQGEVLSSSTTVALVSSEITNKDTEGELEVTLSSRTISCQCSGFTASTDITWYRDETQISGDLYTVTRTELGASTLTFTSLTSVLDDTYKCTFSVGDLLISDSVSVLVNDLVMTDSSSVYVTDTTPISIECKFYAATEQDIIWMVNGVDVKNYKDYQSTVKTAEEGYTVSTLTTKNFDAEVPDTLALICSGTSKAVGVSRAKTDMRKIKSEVKTLNLRMVTMLPAVKILTSSSWVLTCVLQAPDTPTAITWYKGSTELTTGTSTSKDYYLLTNTDSTTTDSGEYTCRFTFSEGPTTEATDSVEVRVLTMQGGEHMLKSAGESVTLVCSITTATPPTDITWTLAKKSKTAELVRTDTTSTSTLTIASSMVKHGGMYVCTAVYANDVNPTANTTLVIADLTTEEASREVEAGDTLSLTCTYTGSQEPDSVYWYKNALKVVPTDGYTIKKSNYGNDVLGMVLYLKDLKSKDVGTFACGATVLETALVVPDIIISLTALQSLNDSLLYHYHSEGSFTLGCEMDASSLPSPIEWGYTDLTGDQTAVVSTSELIDNKVTSYLTISNPTVATSGDYTCTFGTKSVSVNIEVRELRASISGLNDHSYTDEMRLTCAVSSPTSCRVVWYAGDDYYKSGKPTDTKTLSDSGVYTMSRTQPLSGTPGKYDGEYWCQANCKTGPAGVTDTFTVVRQVVTPTDTATSDELVTGSFNRQCVYQGKETPTDVNWYKGDSTALVTDTKYSVVVPKLAPYYDTSYLYVTDPTSADSGTYTCSFEFSDGSGATVLSAETRPVLVIGLSGMGACTVAPSGSPLTLSCVYEGSADYDSVQWFSTYRLAETELTDGVTTGVFAGTSRTSTLVISSPVDMTGYRCEVTLGDSTASLSSTLYTGDISTELQAGSNPTVTGAKVWFYCSTSSSVRGLKWYKDGVELSISKADSISMESSNRYLQMPITEAANVYCTGISTYCSGDEVLTAAPIAMTLVIVEWVSAPGNYNTYKQGEATTLTCAINKATDDMRLDWVRIEDGETDVSTWYGTTYNTDTTVTSKIKIRAYLTASTWYCRARYNNLANIMYSDHGSISRATYTVTPSSVAGLVGGWVSFTCTIQSKYKLVLALMNSNESVVGDVLSTTYAASGDNWNSTTIVKVSSLTLDHGGKYTCSVTLDNGLYKTSAAYLAVVGIRKQPATTWVTSYATFSALTTVPGASIETYNTVFSTTWQKSVDSGSTWTDVAVSSTSYYSQYMTQYKLNLYSVTDSDIAQYRLKIVVGGSDYTEGGTVYSDTAQLSIREVTSITYNIPSLDADGRTALGAVVTFSCNVASDTEPTSYKWDRSLKHMSVTSTTIVESESYSGEAATTVSKYDLAKTITCGVYIGRSYIYSSMVFNPSLSCSNLSTRGNTEITYYTEDSLPHAKISCVGAGTSIADSSDVYAVCDTTTGNWNSTLSYCIKVTLNRIIKWRQSYNVRYCTTMDQQTEIVDLVNTVGDDTCGASSPALNLLCLTEATPNCEFQSTKTSCEYSGGKTVIYIYFYYTGTAENLKTYKDDIIAKVGSFKINCASSRRKRDVSELFERNYLESESAFVEEF